MGPTDHVGLDGSTHMAQTQLEYILGIIERYRADGQPWPATAHQMAEWACNNLYWTPKPSLLVNQCAEELSRGMRDDYIDDPQGRRVRKLHAARTGEGPE